MLTTEAQSFVAGLSEHFESRRRELLERRGEFRRALAKGIRPGFPVETRDVRERTWKVAEPRPDLTDRRVEITGPVDRKMIINALNSGARVFMADFEDSHSPTWTGTVEGQVNLMDAVRRQITFDAPDRRHYALVKNPATLMVRPRGWHLVERHVQHAGAAVSASLFDFGLFVFHNGKELVKRGTGPYFYLPKLEHYLEARLWADVFRYAEESLGLTPGTIRATVLIETLPAAFQMDEILWELREYSAGLNCGRWDYIFSFIKQFRDDPAVVFPDRSALTMATPFLTAYSRLLVRTCHRRGAHAMGGMAAQIPIRDDPEANQAALAKVVEDKEREVANGHDGTWVAHPGLVDVARRVFDQHLKGPNQIDRADSGVPIDPEDLLKVPIGPITEAGLRRDARVSVRYLSAWFRGVGCVPIDHLMEDAATVEIARSQVWQWIRRKTRLEDGRLVDAKLFRQVLETEADALRQEQPDDATGWAVARSATLLDEVVTHTPFTEFITVRAYDELGDDEEEEAG
ncbi:MAG: malate synthase A [Thermoplasmata archaeon]